MTNENAALEAAKSVLRTGLVGSPAGVTPEGKPRSSHVQALSLAFPLTFPSRDPLERAPALLLEGESGAPLRLRLGWAGWARSSGNSKPGRGDSTGGVAVGEGSPAFFLTYMSYCSLSRGSFLCLLSLPENGRAGEGECSAPAH